MRTLFILSVMAIAVAASGASAQQTDRLEGWRQDITVVRNQFLAADRSYSDGERAAALRRLDRLGTNLPSLSDQEIVGEFARVAAASHNAHTRAYLLRNRGWWRRYPIRIWPFADGWRVISVQPGYEALLDARLTRIGGRPIADALRAVRPLYAANEAWSAYMATYLLTSPDALLSAHLVSTDTVRFEGRGARGDVSMVVSPAPFVRRDGPEESWWYLSPAHAANSGWRTVLGQHALPPFLDAPNRNYLFRRCDGDVLYVQFFRAQDGDGETVAQFGERVLAELTAHPPHKLVIDLRFNTGGNLQLAGPFFEALARTATAQRRGGLYAISGISTFSAGITPLAQLRQDARIEIVGQGPGDEMDYWSEGGSITLPYSGILMHYADRMHTYSRVHYRLPADLLALDLNADRVTPNHVTPWRWRDYVAGRDPSLEAIAGGINCSPPVD